MLLTLILQMVKRHTEYFHSYPINSYSRSYSAKHSRVEKETEELLRNYNRDLERKKNKNYALKSYSSNGHYNINVTTKN